MFNRKLREDVKHLELSVSYLKEDADRTEASIRERIDRIEGMVRSLYSHFGLRPHFGVSVVKDENNPNAS